MADEASRCSHASRAGTATRCERVRLEAPGAVSVWFGWATVGADDVARLARAAGLRERVRVEAGGRWFAGLERP